MARRKFESKLIDKNDIKEQLKLIDGSETDYITPSGKIYKDYGNNKFYLKKNYIHKNGYTYCNVTFLGNINKSRRAHRLVANAYLPNPQNLLIVGYKNNIKSCTDVNELYWTTTSENTKRAYNDGLCRNAAGFDDSQANAIKVYTISNEYIETCGSARIAAKKYKVSVSTVLRHCRKEIKTKYRQNYTFRFLNDNFLFSTD